MSTRFERCYSADREHRRCRRQGCGHYMESYWGQVRCQRVPKKCPLLTENIEGAAARVAAIYPEISDLSPSSGRLGQVKYRRAQALAAFKAGRRIADRGPKEMGIVDCRNIGDRDCRNIGDRSDVNAFRKSATLLTGEQRRCRRQGCDRIHGDI
jgi:hypothetical protein